MATVIGRRIKKIPGFHSGTSLKEIPLAVAVVNGGMVADIDPADIKDNQASLLRNARVRRDKTTRRFGKSSHLPAKPNSNAVVRLFDYTIGDFTTFTIRFASGDAYFTTGSAWTQLVGTLSAKITDLAVV